MRRYRGEQYLELRFWQKVNKGNDCWLWRGATNPHGYGLFYMGKSMMAHRVSWLLAHPTAPIPQDRRILHKCDTPTCVRPDHLFLGTQADNVKDMFAKGRGKKAKGESHGLSKLTREQVIEIKQRLAGGESLNRLARSFNVNRSTIGSIRRGLTWAHIIATGKVTE